MIRRWRELLLSFASIALTLLIAEVGFRLYLRHKSALDLARVERQAEMTRIDTCKLGEIIRLSHEPDLFYERKPNLSGRFCGGNVATNAFGMRMKGEPTVEKPTGVMRIVGLGDSYLFGQGVDQGEGYLEALEEIARSIGV